MKNSKKLISVFLALCVILSGVFGFAFNAFAEIRYFERGVLTDGTNTAYYLIDKDNRVLYITGDGITPARTPDYPSAEEGPFAGRTDVTRIVIENDVERIGDYTFANMKSVDTLEIKPTLVKNTSMSTNAMNGCTGLRTIQGDSSFVSTDVLVEVVKGAINAFSGNWLGLVSNVINVGKDGFTSDGNLPDETIDALVDDYINTGNSIYFDDLSTAIDGYNERKTNPCYENKQFNHIYFSSVTEEPTCTEDGITTYLCSRCGDTYTEPINATGHNYVEDTLYEPTCTKKGVKEYTCTVCGDVKLSPITPLGHTPETIPAVEPTCSESGLTEGTKCAVCGEILTAQETVETIPHTYSYSYNAEADEYTGVCDVCGYTANEFENDLSALVSAIKWAKTFNAEDYTTASYQRMYSSIVKYLNLTELSVLRYPQYAVDDKTTEILTRISELAPYLDFSVTTTEGGNIEVQTESETFNKSVRQNIPFGASITLNAEALEGYTFKGWYELKTQRFLSKDSTYTFTMTSNTYLKAVFEESSLITLTMTNDTGQIVEIISKTPAQWSEVQTLSEILPAVPYKYGYYNGKWNYTESQTLSKLRGGINCIIAPYYQSYNVELPAQPVSDGITPALNLSYDLVQKEDGSFAGSFIMAADIPADTDIVEIGTCFFRDKADKFNPTDFILTNNNRSLVSKYEGVDESGIYITNINGLTDRYNWSARGYIVYYNENGILSTVYTNQINIINKEKVGN